MPVKKYIFPDREAWLEGRKNHIGGSEASACVGMNPYKDNVTLWEEKMGLVIPEDISDKDYVQYGTEAEAHLRVLFAMDFPEYRVSYEENNMFLNSDYPWMHASCRSPRGSVNRNHYNTSIFRELLYRYKETGEDVYFDIQITNEDPTSSVGRQTIILKDCNVDGGILAKFDADAEYLDEDLDFTFEDWEMPEKFSMLSGMN